MTHEYANRLGRYESLPDERNWRLSLRDDGDFELAIPTIDPLDGALKAFLGKRYSKEAKNLATLLVQRIEAVTPAPVVPTPNPTPAPTDSVVQWELGSPGVLDQGDTPHCVGFTGADFENLAPVEDHVPGSVGDDLYYACKVVDGEPKAEDGSSIHSLVKVLKARGRIAAYAFMNDVATVKAFVRQSGPVMIGIDWTDGMFDPDANGFIAPTGALVGGHALTIVGDDPALDAAVILNHWGDWGPLHGYCKMKWSNVAGLISTARGGEAVGTLELAA